MLEKIFAECVVSEKFYYKGNLCMKVMPGQPKLGWFHAYLNMDTYTVYLLDKVEATSMYVTIKTL